MPYLHCDEFLVLEISVFDAFLIFSTIFDGVTLSHASKDSVSARGHIFMNWVQSALCHQHLRHVRHSIRIDRFVSHHSF